MKKNILLSGSILCGIFLAPVGGAWAHGVPVTHSPYVHGQGEVALETKSAYNIDGEDDDDSWGGEVTVGYGVTSFWETEAGFEWEGAEHEDTEISAIVWENKFQLAPKGALFVDPGLKIEYAHNVQSGPNELIAKLLLGKDIGQFSNLANISVGREVGEDSANDLEYGFSYALAYQHSDHFAYGLEWYSELGTLENDSDEWDEQSHQIGPVASGSFGHSVGYEAGVLFGVSEHAPDATLKLALDFEF